MPQLKSTRTRSGRSFIAARVSCRVQRVRSRAGGSRLAGHAASVRGLPTHQRASFARCSVCPRAHISDEEMQRGSPGNIRLQRVYSDNLSEFFVTRELEGSPGVSRPAVADRVLIVNADDFGRSAAVNGGIMRAHEHGIVTSASLMVRWPDAEPAAELARGTKLAVGLHFDIGEWEYRDGEWRAVYEVLEEESPDAVERELARQLERFERLVGHVPTHLDSHQHVHRDDARPARPAPRRRTARGPGAPLHPGDHLQRRVLRPGRQGQSLPRGDHRRGAGLRDRRAAAGDHRARLPSGGRGRGRFGL